LPATNVAKPPVPQGAVPVARGPDLGRKVGGLGSSLRKVLILRGERIVLAGCVFGALVLCALGLRRLPYGNSAADLKSEADKVLKDVDSAKTPAKLTKDLAEMPDLKTLQAAAANDVDKRIYKMSPLRLPLEERQPRRGEPDVLPLENLLASAGHGPIAVKGAAATAPTTRSTVRTSPADEKPTASSDAERMQKLLELRKKRAEERAKLRGPARNSKPPKKETKPAEEPVVVKVEPKEKALLSQTPEGSHLEVRSWVCLVGAIPYVRQIDEYERTFRDALYQSPERDIPHYTLPQIERAEVVGGRRLPWQPVRVINALEDHASWATDYPEPIDPRLVDPELTEPLPPLVLANYDTSAVSHPQVEVVRIEKPKPEAPSEEQAAPAATKGEKKQPRPIIGSLRDKKNDAPAEASAGAKNSLATPVDKVPDEPPEERIAYRLFRYIDFDVQPGKTYCYRVKLVALNPNYELPKRFLTESSSAGKLLLETEWSPPCRPVSVVRGTRLLAGAIGVEETDLTAPEPITKILVRFFDFATSTQVVTLLEAVRGSVLNQPSVPLPVAETEPAVNKRPGKPDKAADAVTIDVNTDAVVLDLFGGEAIVGQRDRRTPCHVLVLDKFGGFKTLVQSDDAYTYEADLPAAQSVAATAKPATEQARK
jgi:hypothetical protein